MSEVLREAVDQYRRSRFLADAVAAYQAAPAGRDEDRAWENTLADGLDES